jgi:hypothetical protein
MSVPSVTTGSFAPANRGCIPPCHEPTVAPKRTAPTKVTTSAFRAIRAASRSSRQSAATSPGSRRIRLIRSRSRRLI